jgi:hypothetical protein
MNLTTAVNFARGNRNSATFLEIGNAPFFRMSPRERIDQNQVSQKIHEHNPSHHQHLKPVGQILSPWSPPNPRRW